MINFYRRFIKGAASILKPLTDAMKGARPKHRKLDWRTDMEQAFKKAKVALSEAHPPSYLGPPAVGAGAVPGC